MNEQQAENQRLHHQIVDTNAALVQSNQTTQEQLAAVMDEEKQKAADERQLLMSQIASLINASAESQAKRIDKRISSVRDEMAAATASHSADQEIYVSGIDAWTNKSKDILAGVAKSRDGVKTKLKADFAVSI